MVVNVDPTLEAALKAEASRHGIAPEELVLKVLRERMCAANLPQPRDEWERALFEAARPWGVSFPDTALSSRAL
ncbi:MAG: hypothetical protein U0793_15595 [Gemmataceae bacterium]